MEANVDQRVRERREAIVTEHIGAENGHDIEATIATFDRPRYDVNGEVSDGEAAVRSLLSELLGSASDFHVELLKLHHADDAVICEGRLSGTHDGPFAGIPPTGRSFSYPGVAIFEFEGERLVCEKVCFDSAIFLRQIGVLPEPGA
jgi:steroid delta-isomerase-like uncharacterized protein